jgi:cysteine synthase B
MPKTTVQTPTTIAALVGNTPLVRLPRFELETPGVELYAKTEWQNPSGSVKARAAARIIEQGERSGRLHRGKTILDATSGNTGIAYAMLAAAAGYRLELCVPANVTLERKRMLRAYGAEVIFTDPLEGSDGAITEARRIFAAHPDIYFYADQYNNDANWQAHYDTTGPEIVAQTDGRVTCFVAGLGTSGTFVGTGRRLRQFNPGIRLVSVQPDEPFHGLEGLKHMDTAIVPGIYDESVADVAATVTTERAHELTRRLAAEEGLLAGISSGAALAAAIDVAADMDGGVIVMIFPDGGERYLTEAFWEERPKGRRAEKAEGPKGGSDQWAGERSEAGEREARPRAKRA